MRVSTKSAKRRSVGLRVVSSPSSGNGSLDLPWIGVGVRVRVRAKVRVREGYGGVLPIQ